MSAKIPDFWDKDCLRVFISHSVKNCNHAKQLKKQLMDSGISCFVAHKDIEPTKQWKEEIKKALRSMEMMFCLITKDSCESWWVNQEIGFALAKDIPVIPIKLDEHDPKGFINEIQAMSLDINRIESHAHDVIRLIIKEIAPQYPSVKKHFLNQFFEAKYSNFQHAKKMFMFIIYLKFNDQEIEKIVTTIKRPAHKGMNQLEVLLLDRINTEHLRQLQNNQYTYYAELLNNKVLSQHTQKRYSIKKSNKRYGFEIIDSQTMIARKQKITNKQKLEEFPF